MGENTFKISLSIKPKNGTIYDYMKKNGLSIKEFAGILGVGYSYLNGVINFKYVPKTDKGPSTNKLLDYFGCSFQEMFPSTKLKLISGEKVITKEIPIEKLISYEETDEKLLGYVPKHICLDFEDNKFQTIIKKLTSILTKREEEVLICRYYKNKTLTETAKKLNISRERVRQIELKFIRKLRNPSNSEYLEELKEYL